MEIVLGKFRHYVVGLEDGSTVITNDPDKGVECFKELLKKFDNAPAYAELGRPPLEDIEVLSEKHKRFYTIEMSNVAATLNNFRVFKEDEEVIVKATCELKPIANTEDIVSYNFGLRAFVTEELFQDKPVKVIKDIITWDLLPDGIENEDKSDYVTSSLTDTTVEIETSK